MTVPVVLLPSAEDDLRETYEMYESVRVGLGDRFLASVREVLIRLEDFPCLYGVVWKDIRAARLRRFRYVLYYMPLEQRTEVIAVLHGARDPSVWRARY